MARAQEQGLMEPSDGFLNMANTRTLIFLVLKHVSQSVRFRFILLVDLVHAFHFLDGGRVSDVDRCHPSALGFRAQ